VERALSEDPSERLRDADAFLTRTSWDGTWTQMYRLVAAAMAPRERASAHGTAPVVSEPGVA
jgi:hypothetical protein